MRTSGVYIVTLTNEVPISVNAHDVRRAHLSIEVTRRHCKIGKATDLSGRERNYWKTFGEANVHFKVIAFTDDPAAAERAILKHLRKHRVRGSNGCLNEWLADIDPAAAERAALEAMRKERVLFMVPKGMHAA
jgi:hypothetical protein